MTDQKKTNKFKQFIADHPTEIIYGVAAASLIGWYAIALKSADKAAQKAIAAHNEYAEMANNFIEKANEEGQAVFLLADWTYLLVPKDTPTQWIQDITKL